MKYSYYVVYRYGNGQLFRTQISGTNLKEVRHCAKAILDPLYQKQLVIVLYTEPYKSKIVEILEFEDK